LQNFHPTLHPCFRDPQRALEQPNFLRCFLLSRRPEKPIARFQRDPLPLNLISKTQREISRYLRPLYSPFPQKMRQDFFVGRRLLCLALYFAFELAEHDKLVRLRILLRPIDLQIAQDERALPVLLKKNERIADEDPCRVKHIGIGIAGRDNKRANSGFVAIFRSYPRRAFCHPEQCRLPPSHKATAWQ